MYDNCQERYSTLWGFECLMPHVFAILMQVAVIGPTSSIINTWESMDIQAVQKQKAPVLYLIVHIRSLLFMEAADFPHHSYEEFLIVWISRHGEPCDSARLPPVETRREPASPRRFLPIFEECSCSSLFFFRSHAPTTTGHRSGLFPLFEVPSSVDFVLCDAWKPQLVDGDRWMGAMSKKGLGNSVFFLKGLISADMFGCKRSGMFLELNMCTRCGGILCAFAATLYHWFSSLRHSH